MSAAEPHRQAPNARQLLAWRVLAVDATTVEVIGALEAAGIDVLLLKGPTFTALLYDRGEVRRYGDTDLLVRPADRLRAQQLLAQTGFEPSGHSRPVDPASEAVHEWSRGERRVDLHSELDGCAAAPETVWDVLWADRASLTIGGRDIAVLAPDARLLQVVLHAAHHGELMEHTTRDLDRALERFDRARWWDVATLAVELDAAPAFAAGLRIVPAGAVLADTLELPREAPVRVVLAARSSPPAALGWEQLRRQRTPSEQGRYAVRRVFVPRSELIKLYPEAADSRGAAALARTRRALWVARTALPGLRAWREAHRAASGRPPRRTPWARAAIVLEAAGYLTWASAAIALLSSARVTKLLGQPSDPEAGPAARPPDEARRVGRVVGTVADALPWRCTCLPQALATQRMLARREIPAAAHLGVWSTAPFEAHAWVTARGAVVIGGRIDDVTRLATFR